MTNKPDTVGGDEVRDPWKHIHYAPTDRPIMGYDAAHGFQSIVRQNIQGEWECVSYQGTMMGTGFYPTHFAELHKPPQHVHLRILA